MQNCRWRIGLTKIYTQMSGLWITTVCLDFEVPPAILLASNIPNSLCRPSTEYLTAFSDFRHPHDAPDLLSPSSRLEDGRLTLPRCPSRFDEDGVVHFQRHDRPESKIREQEKGICPDIDVYATRYKRSFPFLPVNDSRYPTVDDANTCGIYRDIKDGIAYIGFVRPTLRKCQ